MSTVEARPANVGSQRLLDVATKGELHDPLNDAIDYARHVLPIVRQELARRRQVHA